MAVQRAQRATLYAALSTLCADELDLKGMLKGERTERLSHCSSSGAFQGTHFVARSGGTRRGDVRFLLPFLGADECTVSEFSACVIL